MHQLAWSCISEIVPRKHRPLAIGFLEGSISVPSILGPLVGFMLIEHTHLGWRNIFWIALAINGASLLLIALFYHPVNQYVAEEGKTKSQQVKSLDYVGFVLFAIGLCLFLVGLSFGGTQFPWYVIKNSLLRFMLITLKEIRWNSGASSYRHFIPHFYWPLGKVHLQSI
jgi:predicted MFS family arabinose efflux permease